MICVCRWVFWFLICIVIVLDLVIIWVLVMMWCGELIYLVFFEVWLYWCDSDFILMMDFVVCCILGLLVVELLGVFLGRWGFWLVKIFGKVLVIWLISCVVLWLIWGGIVWLVVLMMVDLLIVWVYWGGRSGVNVVVFIVIIKVVVVVDSNVLLIWLRVFNFVVLEVWYMWWVSLL